MSASSSPGGSIGAADRAHAPGRIGLDDLVVAAAIGTGTRQLDADRLPASVRAAVPREADPAVALLDAASALVGVRRSQLPPGPSDGARVWMPPETSIPASARVEALVVRLMEEFSPDAVSVLYAVVRDLAAGGQHLSAPVQMQLVRHRPPMPAALFPLLSPPVAALVASDVSLRRSLDWGPVAIGADLSGIDSIARPLARPDWNGTPEERAAAVWDLRRRDPGAGLGLAFAGMETGATAAQKALLVDGLRVHLSMADEHALETWLHQGPKAVSASCRQLLQELPESRLVARLGQSAAGGVQHRKRFMRAGETTWQPVEMTPDLERDLGPVPGASSAPYAVLEALVRLVPSAAWPRLAGASIADLVRTSSSVPVVDGLLDAARVNADADLARALVRHCRPGQLPAAYSLLPDAEAVQVLRALIRAHGEGTATVLPYAWQLGAPRAAVKAVLAVEPQWATRPGTASMNALRYLAAVAPPDMLPTVAEAIERRGQQADLTRPQTDALRHARVLCALRQALLPAVRDSLQRHPPVVTVSQPHQQSQPQSHPQPPG